MDPKSLSEEVCPNKMIFKTFHCIGQMPCSAQNRLKQLDLA